MPRPALVLLHGALGAADQLTPLADRLADAFDVRTLDFEGHGPLAPPARPITMDALAGAVRDHVEAHALAALLCARRFPGTIDRVMTLGTKLAWTPDAAAREAGYLDADRLLERVPAFAAQLAARHGGGHWRALLAATRDMMLALGAAPALTDADWPRIACPVRIAVGDRDATVTVEECVAAYRALPAGELEVLARTQHPLERVDVGRLAAAVAVFMA
jgi:pimeloyl-ACP methyl ester carboxylesterase